MSQLLNNSKLKWKKCYWLNELHIQILAYYSTKTWLSTTNTITTTRVAFSKWEKNDYKQVIKMCVHIYIYILRYIYTKIWSDVGCRMIWYDIQFIPSTLTSASYTNWTTTTITTTTTTKMIKMRKSTRGIKLKWVIKRQQQVDYVFVWVHKTQITTCAN